MIREFSIEGSVIYTFDTFFDEISRLLTFPDFISKDLSGLYDGLNSYTAMPLKLLWNNHHLSEKALRNDFQRIISVFNEVQDYHPDFEFYLN